MNFFDDMFALVLEELSSSGGLDGIISMSTWSKFRVSLSVGTVENLLFAPRVDRLLIVALDKISSQSKFIVLSVGFLDRVAGGIKSPDEFKLLTLSILIGTNSVVSRSSPDCLLRHFHVASLVALWRASEEVVGASSLFYRSLGTFTPIYKET